MFLIMFRAPCFIDALERLTFHRTCTITDHIKFTTSELKSFCSEDLCTVLLKRSILQQLSYFSPADWLIFIINMKVQSIKF